MMRYLSLVFIILKFYCSILGIVSGFYLEDFGNHPKVQLGRSGNTKSTDSLLANCGDDLTTGMCIHSSACPWNKLMPSRREICLRDADSVCCEVARVRVPTDIFSTY